MGRLLDLVDSYRNRYNPHPPSYSRVAEQLDVTRQTMTNWKAPRELPDKEVLVRLADLVGVPYRVVLEAVLFDIGYLERDQVAVTRRSRGSYARATQLRAVADGGDPGDAEQVDGLAAEQRRRQTGSSHRPGTADPDRRD